MLRSEWLDRLHATVVRARDDPRDRRVGQLVDERQSLCTPILVERPAAIVARPIGSVARTRVADEQQGLRL
jgi:hypothetical protein